MIDAGCKFKLSAEKLKQVKNGFSSEFLVHAYYVCLFDLFNC